VVSSSRLHVMQALEDSLRRLGTDHIDLYQIHNHDPVTPIEETLSALDDAVRQGKIRYIGASNLAAWQLAKALGVSDRRGQSRFVASQSYYSLAGRDIEAELVPLPYAPGRSGWARR
jgi:aryl-alcohol dehydrogenase-like predicted oxidoreductase